jgi:hypothetical protein
MMKKWSSLFSLFAIAGLALSAFGSTASAQVLDGTWLKIQVAMKGVAVDSAGGVQTARDNAVVYLHVSWNADNSEYDYVVWWEISDGVWEAKDSDNSFAMEDNDFIFLPDNEWDIETPDTAFHFSQTSVIRVWAWGDSLGTAIFLSLGGEVNSGPVGGESNFYGGAQLLGWNIPASELPFEPGDAASVR